MPNPPEQYAEYKEPYLELNPIRSVEFAKIECPSCNKEVDVNDVNIHDKIGKCCDCNIVFPIDNSIKNLTPSPKKVRQEIIRPEGIDLFYFDDALEISSRQPLLSIEFIPMIASVIIFVIGFLISLSKGSFYPILLSLAPLPFGYWYKQRKEKHHRVYLTIDKENVKVEWKPRIFKKDKSYNSKEIDQLYIKHSAKFLGAFDIMMILDNEDGQKHILLSAAETITKAKFLEQEIEKHLQIQDREVIEELN